MHIYRLTSFYLHPLEGAKRLERTIRVRKVADIYLHNLCTIPLACVRYRHGQCVIVALLGYFSLADAEPGGFDYIEWDENAKRIVHEEIKWNDDWRRNSYYTLKMSILEYLEENYSQFGVQLLVICNY